MEDGSIKVKCFLCEKERACGPHRYEGRNVPAWNVWICDSCREGNWDGIQIDDEQGGRLIQELDDNEIPYRLNAKGWLEIPD